MKNIGHVIVCLMLVACLMVGISPVHAAAITSVEAETFFVEADLAVGSALIALGILPGSMDSDFDSFVSSIISDDDFTPFIIDGKMELIHYTENDGSNAYAIPLDFLDSLKDWLYDSEVVVSEYQPGFGSRIAANTLVTIRDDGTAIYGTHDFIFCPITTSAYPSIDNCVGYAVSTDPDFMGYNHKNVQVCPQRTPFTYKNTLYYYITWSRNNDLVNPYDAYVEGVDFMEALYKAIDGELDLSTTSYDTSYDLSLSVVGRENIGVSDVHIAWVDGAVSFDGSTMIYLPIALAATYDDAKELSQEDIQFGSSSYDDGSSDEGTEPTVPGDPGNDGSSSNRYVDAVSSDFLQGILDEIIDILPVIIPVSIALVGITKGISFLISVIKRG